MNTPLAQRGFTLVELWVVMAIICILAALLLPSLSRAKASALSAACKGNLRQIGIGLRLYVDEQESSYPIIFWGDVGKGGKTWDFMLLPYCGNSISLFRCPSQPKRSAFDEWVPTGGANFSYAYNSAGTSVPLGLGISGYVDLAHNILEPIAESRVRVPSEMIAISDNYGYGDMLGFGWPGIPIENDRTRAGKHGNAVFCDGHTESTPRDVHIESDLNHDGSWHYKPDAAYARRWNNDNQPHSETWAQP